MGPPREMDKPGKIMVAGIPKNDTFTEADLEKEFSPFGRITEVSVVKDSRKKQSRGYGFVTYENPKDANDAIKAMEGKDLGAGKPLHCEQATVGLNQQKRNEVHQFGNSRPWGGHGADERGRGRGGRGFDRGGWVRGAGEWRGRGGERGGLRGGRGGGEMMRGRGGGEMMRGRGGRGGPGPFRGANDFMGVRGPRGGFRGGAYGRGRGRGMGGGGGEEFYQEEYYEEEEYYQEDYGFEGVHGPPQPGRRPLLGEDGVMRGGRGGRPIRKPLLPDPSRGGYRGRGGPRGGGGHYEGRAQHHGYEGGEEYYEETGADDGYHGGGGYEEEGMYDEYGGGEVGEGSGGYYDQEDHGYEQQYDNYEGRRGGRMRSGRGGASGMESSRRSLMDVPTPRRGGGMERGGPRHRGHGRGGMESMRRPLMEVPTGREHEEQNPGQRRPLIDMSPAGRRGGAARGRGAGRSIGGGRDYGEAEETGVRPLLKNPAQRQDAVGYSGEEWRAPLKHEQSYQEEWGGDDYGGYAEDKQGYEGGDYWNDNFNNRGGPAGRGRGRGTTRGRGGFETGALRRQALLGDDPTSRDGRPPPAERGGRRDRYEDEAEEQSYHGSGAYDRRQSSQGERYRDGGMDRGTRKMPPGERGGGYGNDGYHDDPQPLMSGNGYGAKKRFQDRDGGFDQHSRKRLMDEGAGGGMQGGTAPFNRQYDGMMGQAAGGGPSVPKRERYDGGYYQGR